MAALPLRSKTRPMLDCLDEIITLPGCEGAEPTSGYYITDLEGIDLAFIGSLTNHERKTFDAVWATIIKRANIKLGPILLRKFKECWKVKTLACVETIVCADVAEFTQGLLYFYGAELQLERILSTTWTRWTQTTEEAKEARAYYLEEFEKALQLFVETRDINPCDDSECFECGGDGPGLHTITVLP